MKRIPASEKMRKELLKGVEAEKFLSSEILEGQVGLLIT